MRPLSKCSTRPLTSNMAPAHPHATGVAVYPALFLFALKFDALAYFTSLAIFFVPALPVTFYVYYRHIAAFIFRHRFLVHVWMFLCIFCIPRNFMSFINFSSLYFQIHMNGLLTKIDVTTRWKPRKLGLSKFWVFLFLFWLLFSVCFYCFVFIAEFVWI